MSDRTNGPSDSPASIALGILGSIGQSIISAASSSPPKRTRSKNAEPPGAGCKPCAARARVWDAQQATKALRKNIIGGR